MKIVSIDLETSGLDFQKSQILQIGACIFDTCSSTYKSISTYNKVIDWKEIHGEPFAIQMNVAIIRRIIKEQNAASQSNNIISIDLLADDFRNWLDENDAYYLDANGKQHLNVTGKNFWGFDNRFLELVPNWTSRIRPHRRSFDPSNLFFDPEKNVLPSLQECKEIAKRMYTNSEHAYLFENTNDTHLFENTNVTHDALDDAEDVAKLIWIAMHAF